MCTRSGCCIHFCCAGTQTDSCYCSNCCCKWDRCLAWLRALHHEHVVTGGGTHLSFFARDVVSQTRRKNRNRQRRDNGVNDLASDSYVDFTYRSSEPWAFGSSVYLELQSCGEQIAVEVLAGTSKRRCVCRLNGCISLKKHIFLFLPPDHAR